MKARLGALLFALALLAPGFAHAASIKAFFGHYEGVTSSDVDHEIKPRDLSVDISRYGRRGFTIRWTAVIRKSDGRMKHLEESVNFEPSRRPGIYSSAMRRNLFGEAKPLNPFKGEPFVWATLHGDTLTVYALLITDDGGYEMQSYARTLTADGLELHFQRVRDGVRLRDIDGTLRRVPEAQLK